MADDHLQDLYEEVGRVVVPAALLEQALATIAYGALGGGAAAYKKTHAHPTTELRKIIERQADAQPSEWWSGPIVDVLERASDPIEARNRVVHSYWTDLRGLSQERSFVTFKPDRKRQSWYAQLFDLEQLRVLGTELRALAREARDIADRLVDEVGRW